MAAYLSSLADSGRKASTIGRRAAAIGGYHHKMAGYEPPTGSERPSRRSCGVSGAPSAQLSRARRRQPRTLIGQMVTLCPDNMIGKRDRALLCLELCRGVPAPVSSARSRSPISPKSPMGCASGSAAARLTRKALTNAATRGTIGLERSVGTSAASARLLRGFRRWAVSCEIWLTSRISP